MTVMQEIIAKTFLVVENKDKDWLEFVGDISRAIERRVADGERDGQAIFNAVAAVGPIGCALDLRGSMKDPFHNNDRIPEFVEAVFDYWLAEL